MPSESRDSRLGRLRAGSIVALAFVWATTPQAADFSLTRWSEDWREHSDPSRRAAPLDAIKHVPLSGNPDHYLSFGGQLRYKAVSSAAPLFGLGGAGSDGYLYQRLNLHADLHAGALRAFAELGDARVFGKDGAPAPTDSDRAELRLVFADFRAPAGGGTATLRLGRQEFMFDATQRFVALREGPNVRRAFDGARLIWAAGALEATAFAASPVDNRDGEAFDDATERGTDFSGLRLRYGERAATQLDGYWYHYARDAATFGGTRAPERRDVFGLQCSGRSGVFDWDVEAVYQDGRFGSEDIRAWAFGSILGGRLATGTWQPRAGVQFDAASGDRDADDDRLETFNPLFPNGSYFSQAGLTDFSNLVHAGAFVTVQPLARASLGLAAGRLRRQSRADAAYAQPMRPIPHSITAELDIGHYLRLNAAYRFNARLTLAAEALHSAPDAALRRAGARSADYAELVAKFMF